jgi:transcriptional regulator with XRE-family HTH domain
MKDRLLKLITHLGLTATRFADEIGVQRSGISHIISGRNQPSYDFILKITTRYPEISLDWLLLDKGSMMRIPAKAPLPVQKDLFSQIQPEISKIQPVSHPIKEKVAQTTESKVTDVTSPERVVFFYADGTFSTYLPRN